VLPHQYRNFHEYNKNMKNELDDADVVARPPCEPKVPLADCGGYLAKAIAAYCLNNNF
jgi:hypothetical protein